MLERLKRLFGEPAGPEPQPRAHDFEERQLAAAALLVEAATMDGHFDAAERASVESLIRGRFGLDAATAADLLQQAAREGKSLRDRGPAILMQLHLDVDLDAAREKWQRDQDDPMLPSCSATVLHGLLM